MITFSAETDWLPNRLHFSEDHNLHFWTQPALEDSANYATYSAPLEGFCSKLPKDTEDMMSHLERPLPLPLGTDHQGHSRGYLPPTTVCVESYGPVSPVFSVPDRILTEIMEAWEIPKTHLDGTQKPRLFPLFSSFEDNNNLHENRDLSLTDTSIEDTQYNEDESNYQDSGNFSYAIRN